MNRRLGGSVEAHAKKITGDHPRNTGPMPASPRGAKTRSGKVLQVAGGARQQALSDAWRRAGIGRTER
jgi:hypothetical protein